MKNRMRAFRLEMLEERCLLSVAPWGDGEEGTALVAAAESSSSSAEVPLAEAFSSTTEMSKLSFPGETLCQMAVDGTSLAVLSHDKSTSTGYLRFYQWEKGTWNLQAEKTKTFLDVDTSQFGQSLAMDGKNILINSGGKVSVFYWNGYAFSETVLSSSVCVSASLDGDVAVIGGENSVSVYRNTILGWQLEKRWEGEHGQSLGANVLYDAATERLFVADYTENTAGTVTVYTRDSGKWTLQQRLSGVLEFGCSLSVDGNTLAVGAVNEVMLWECSDASGQELWQNVQRLDYFSSTSETVFPGGQFGSSVYLSGDRLWVGDPLASISSTSGPSVTGAVYTFEKTETGWENGEVFLPSDSENFLYYGQSLCLCEDFALVMVPGNGTIVTYHPGESDKESLQVESILLDGNQVIIGFSEILADFSTQILEIGSLRLLATEILNGNKVVWTLPAGFSEGIYSITLTGISDQHGCSLETTLDWVYDKTPPTIEAITLLSESNPLILAKVVFSEDMSLPLENGFLLADGEGNEYPLHWEFVDGSTRTVTLLLEESLPDGEYLLWIQGRAMGWCDEGGNPMENVGHRFVVGNKSPVLSFSSGKASVFSYLLTSKEVLEYTVALTAGKSYQWSLQDSLGGQLLLEVYDGKTLLAQGSVNGDEQQIAGWVPDASQEYTIRISWPEEVVFPGDVSFTLEGTEKTAVSSELQWETSIQDGDALQRMDSVQVKADRSFDLSKMDIRNVTLTDATNVVKTCTGYSWVDGQTVQFFFDNVSEGTWTLKIAEGTVYFLDGKTGGLERTFTVDQTRPVNPTLSADWNPLFVLSEGNTETLKLSLYFNEAIHPESFSLSDIHLTGTHSSNTTDLSCKLSADGRTLTLDLGHLSMDSYMLTLNTTGAFTDLAGNRIQTNENFTCTFGVISEATLPLPESTPQMVGGDVVSQTTVSGYVTKTQTNRYSWTIPEGGRWFSWTSDDAITVTILSEDGSARTEEGRFLEAGNYLLEISLPRESTLNRTAYALLLGLSEMRNTLESAATLELDREISQTLPVCGGQTGAHYYELPAFSHGLAVELSSGFSVSVVDSSGNSVGTFQQNGTQWVMLDTLPTGYFLKVTANDSTTTHYTLFVEELTNSVSLRGTVSRVTFRFEYPVEDTVWENLVTIQKEGVDLTDSGTFALNADGRTLTWIPEDSVALSAGDGLEVWIAEKWGNTIPLKGAADGQWSGSLTISSAISVSMEGVVTDINSQKVTWLHEWQTHFVEIYATADTAVSGADLTVKLNYRPDLFTLDTSSLPTGWEVSEETSGTLVLSGLSGDLTEEGKLLGKIRFVSVPGGGILLDKTVAVLPTEELGLQVVSVSGVDDAGGELDGSGTVPSLNVYPVLYDLNDSGKIDIADLILFAKNFSNSATASPMAFYCDWNHSGVVDIADLILFAKNFSLAEGGTIVFSSNYPLAWATGQNLVLSEDSVVRTEEIPAVLEQNALDTLSEVVVARATVEFGVTVPANVLETVTFRVADLGGNVLATQIGNVIWVDQTAAGCGWYLDATPYDDTDDVFNGQVDLLTVLFHEWGHFAGEEHSEDESDWMWESLATGVRRLPDVMDKIFGAGAIGSD